MLLPEGPQSLDVLFMSVSVVCTCVHAHMWCGNLRLMSGVFLSCSLPDCLRPEPASKASLASHFASGILCVPSEAAVRIGLHLHGCIRSEFCSLACTVITSSIEPCPQPWALDLHAGVGKKKQGPVAESSFWYQWGFLVVQKPVIHELEGLTEVMEAHRLCFYYLVCRYPQITAEHCIGKSTDKKD